METIEVRQTVKAIPSNVRNWFLLVRETSTLLLHVQPQTEIDRLPLDQLRRSLRLTLLPHPHPCGEH